MLAPPGMALARTGSVLVDEAGETIVIVAQGDDKFNLENNPAWRKVYRHPPEQIDTKDIVGNLYRRTRAADGGAWDGWYFSASRGSKNLTMMVSYAGNSPEAFSRLRDSILTLTWDESTLDPELAMGVRMAVPGLQVVRDTFGALYYNETGQFGAPGPALIVQALPLSSYKASQIFPSGCEKILGTVFPANAMSGPNQAQNGSVRFCESWSKTVAPEMRYMALVRLPNGGIITVMGSATSVKFDEMLPKFRVAVRDLQPIKGRQ